MSRLKGYFSLADNTNKVKTDHEEETKEGVVSSLVPELALSLSDEELIDRKKTWEKDWAKATKELKEIQEENEKYWLGQHHKTTGTKKPKVDNRLFMALETFLPIATRQNPEPVVEGKVIYGEKDVPNTVQKMLAYQADIQRLKLKLKGGTRNWALYHLGVWKIGWDNQKDDIKTSVVRPQRLILDPNSTIEDGVHYTGEYIGEIRKDTAKNLSERFSGKAAYIKEKVSGKMGTRMQYIEWWTDEFTFWTLDDQVLGKIKNPHWNYDEATEKIDEYGNVIPMTVPGLNHFYKKTMPYVFISIFNTGKKPYDDTGLIQQNISLQDQVNDRMEQIEKNVNAMNSGNVLSGDHFTKEQAAEAGRALNNGDTLWVPTGDVNTAYKREQGTPLPSDVFNNLQDSRNEIDNIFGTHATTRGERGSSETASGRILLKESDTSRIGGGVTEYLEQVADQIFNWWVQMMYVYYDQEHAETIVGSEQAQEYLTLIKDDFENVQKLTVSVKEGSLVPTDDITERNQAIDLWSAGALSILDLYIALKFPDPKAATERWIAQQTQNYQALLGQEDMVTPLMQQQPEVAPVPSMEDIPLTQ